MKFEEDEHKKSLMQKKAQMALRAEKEAYLNAQKAKEAEQEAAYKV